MNVFLAFIFGIIILTVIESRSDLHVRTSWIVVGCALLAVGFTFERVIL